jgi:formylglycine-generating enzyme required for sulfatase activity
MINSAVTSALYTITAPEQVATPVLTPSASSYSNQTVTITCATADAVIRYTTNGTVPTATVGTVYTAAFTVSSTTTVKAIATKTDMIDSDVASATYTKLIYVAPAVSLASGSLGVAGDTKITGLTATNKYVVVTGGKTYGVLAGGTLGAENADAEALTGTEVTGLTNGTVYKVVDVTSLVLLETGSLGVADNAKVTGLTATKIYVVKTGASYYGVLANGTLFGTLRATAALAHADAEALTGTEITGLTNGNIYKVTEESLVSLASGSLGVAGDAKVTDLTATKMYVVKTGANYYGVLANGTLFGTLQATAALAHADAEALTGTEITGLTNGNIYKVEEPLASFFITSKVVGNVNATHGWDDGASTTEEGGHVELTVTAKNIDGTTMTGYVNNGTLSIAATIGVVQWEGSNITDNLSDNSDNGGTYADAFSSGIAYIYVRNSRAGELTVTVTDGTDANFKGTINLTWTAESTPPALVFEGENSKGFRKYSCIRDSTVKIIKIPAGPFERGDGFYGGAVTTMRMSSYYIAESPTTNQQFKNWRNSSSPPALQGSWSDPGSYYDHPAINVTWNDAKRYSYWLMTGTQSTVDNSGDATDSQYLQTEAQYEKAARGVKFMNWAANNAVNKLYPWGTTVPSDDNLCNTSWTASIDERILEFGKGTRPITASYNPMGYYGLQDISGNAWQWCRDWLENWGEAYPEAAGTLDPLHNTVKTNRVFRGGPWSGDQASYFRASFRFCGLPSHNASNVASRPVLKP